MQLLVRAAPGRVPVLVPQLAGVGNARLGDWGRLRGIEADGCLVVRPDRHIVWRSRTAVEDPHHTLTAAMARLLAREPRSGDSRE